MTYPNTCSNGSGGATCPFCYPGGPLGNGESCGNYNSGGVYPECGPECKALAFPPINPDTYVYSKTATPTTGTITISGNDVCPDTEGSCGLSTKIISNSDLTASGSRWFTLSPPSITIHFERNVL